MYRVKMGLLLVGTFLSTPLWAQEAETAAVGSAAITDDSTVSTEQGGAIAARSFSPADFAQFAPQTALDMVALIPGFTIQGGNQGARGLGEANQNVLINGQRVSGKNNDARDVLSRIPANAVERIDIVDGATLSVAGLSGQVVNVIADSGSWSGSFAYRPEFRRDVETNWGRFDVSASGKVGGSEVSLAVRNDAFRNGHSGPEVRRDANGALIRTIDETGTYYADVPSIRASLARTMANGNILNLNGSFALFNFDRRITGIETAADGTMADELDSASEDEWNFELGGDYEFALGGGRMKLIGLRRQEHSPTVFAFERLARSPGAVLQGSRFDQVVDEAESILRGEYRFSGLGGDLQLSLEGVYNSLESEAQLFIRDSNGAEVEVPLPGANAKVEEKRAESIISYGRPLASNLSLQASLGGEISEISAGNVQRSYFRPKGSLSLAWQVDKDLTINSRIERRIDQLSFFDFLASVDVTRDADDRANNFELVPPERLRAELEFVQKLGAWGSITPELRIAVLDNWIDTIPISPTEQALGNLDGTAFLYMALLEGTLLFDPIGWKGARLNINANVLETSVEDPLTGENRPLSSIGRYAVNVDLRHDIPNSDWAWGAGLNYNEGTASYRLDQIARQYNDSPFILLFVENKDVAGMTMRASFMNLLNTKDAFERTVYVGRRTGPIAFTEQFERDFGPFLRLDISGKF